MKQINTDKYNIQIGHDSLAVLAGFLSEKKYSSVFILVDENTKKHCLKFLRPLPLPALTRIIQIKSSEKNKNLRTCEKIWNELSKKNADRKSLLINLGGGVITDLGGFAASTYKRGIDFINLPTTLLSQVDASVGGKTGIDLLGYKNQIGTFAFPKAVFINPDFLKTLNKREMISGFAEVIKHGLIADGKYWKAIKEIPGIGGIQEIGDDIIIRSIEIKNSIVSADPYEKGIRKALNFGHTIGHAIESAALKTKKPLLHGEAIAIGMICEAYLSRKCCGLSSDALNEIVDFIKKVFHPKKISASEGTLLKLMQQDKKNQNSELNFTLLSSIGKAEINQSCSEELIAESLKYYGSLCGE